MTKKGREQLNELIDLVSKVDACRLYPDDLRSFKSKIYLALVDIRDDDCAGTLSISFEELKRLADLTK